MFGEWKLTDGGRKVLESIRGETQKQRAFANPRIPNHQKLEQVIEFGVTRRRGRSIHSEPQKWEKQTNWFNQPHLGSNWMAIVLDWIWEIFLFVFTFSFSSLWLKSRLGLSSMESGSRGKGERQSRNRVFRRLPKVKENPVWSLSYALQRSAVVCLFFFGFRLSVFSYSTCFPFIFFGLLGIIFSFFFFYI